MATALLILGIVLIIGIIDCYFYSKARVPNRCEWYYIFIIGGGIAAYFIEGKDIED